MRWFKNNKAEFPGQEGSLEINSRNKSKGKRLEFSFEQIPDTSFSTPIKLIIIGAKLPSQYWIYTLNPILKIAIERGFTKRTLKRKYAIDSIKNRGMQNKNHYVSAIALEFDRCHQLTL